MSAPLLSRPPTCLSCLRRSFVAPSSSSTQLGLASLPLTQQVRGKKTKPPKDRGCVVRLLEDIPQYGRKNAIIRTERARMRNLWLPHKKAEYMTTARFAELGLKLNDEDVIGERDNMFAVPIEKKTEDDLDDILDLDSMAEPVFKGIPPMRAVALLNMILPSELTFRRKIILEGAHTPVPEPEPAKRSPLIADSARVTSNIPDAPAASATPITRIFGSVSADDVAARIRSLCQTAAAAGELDAGLIRVEGRDVQFVLGGKIDRALEDAERVRALGKWEVDVVLRGEGDEVQVLKRVVEVAAAE